MPLHSWRAVPKVALTCPCINEHTDLPCSKSLTGSSDKQLLRSSPACKAASLYHSHLNLQWFGLASPLSVWTKSPSCGCFVSLSSTSGFWAVTSVFIAAAWEENASIEKTLQCRKAFISLSWQCQSPVLPIPSRSHRHSRPCPLQPSLTHDNSIAVKVPQFLAVPQLTQRTQLTLLQHGIKSHYGLPKQGTCLGRGHGLLTPIRIFLRWLPSPRHSGCRSIPVLLQTLGVLPQREPWHFPSFYFQNRQT